MGKKRIPVFGPLEYSFTREQRKQYSIIGPESAFKISKMVCLEKQEQEIFAIISLNTRNVPICIYQVGLGTSDACLVHPKDVFRHAILDNAKGIICLHNHPSENVKPSSDDIELYKRLNKAGKILGIEVLDFIIVGDGFFSFREEGMMVIG